MDFDPELRRQFEEMGVDTVRVRLEKFQGNVYAQAIAWLSAQDKAERMRQAWFAWVTVVAAVVAAVTGIFALLK